VRARQLILVTGNQRDQRVVGREQSRATGQRARHSLERVDPVVAELQWPAEGHRMGVSSVPSDATVAIEEDDGHAAAAQAPGEAQAVRPTAEHDGREWITAEPG